MGSFFIHKFKRKRGYLIAQKFITYEQQLNKLQADKGLTMDNNIQTKVSKAFPQYTEKQLHQFISRTNSFSAGNSLNIKNRLLSTPKCRKQAVSAKFQYLIVDNICAIINRWLYQQLRALANSCSYI